MPGLAHQQLAAEPARRGPNRPGLEPSRQPDRGLAGVEALLVVAVPGQADLFADRGRERADRDQPLHRQERGQGISSRAGNAGRITPRMRSRLVGVTSMVPMADSK